MLNNQIDGWIRFITVLGYIVFVSLPAVCLSIYYVYIWDPQYLKNFPNHTMVNKSYTVYKPKDQRQTRQTFESPLYDKPPSYAKNNQECTCVNPVPIRPTQEISPSLGHILSSSVSHEADASSKIEPERGQQLPTSQSSESRPISSSSESYSASQEFRSKSVEAG
ncbi:unnamed protein product, partial [Mesorhabditis spiculigera]